MVSTKKYDIIHAVEESVFMAWFVWVFTRKPFIYDMDSSMVTQILDKFPLLKFLSPVMRFMESLPMRHAFAVIPVCQALADDVYKYREKNVVILKDVSLVKEGNETIESDDLRKLCGIQGAVLLYIGNLESYQGIDLLIESFVMALQAGMNAGLIIIGGEDVDISKYKEMAKRLNADKHVHLIGKRPVSQIGAYMRQADVLVSPRIHGVNTPMKVYSYLHSGVAVLATDMPTHTQVMTPEIAMLARPDPDEFACAMRELVDQPRLQKQLATKAVSFIEEEHSYPAFTKVLYGLYDKVENLVVAK